LLSASSTIRGVARNLLGGQNRGSGDGSPQRGPEAEPRWGLGAKHPEAGDIILNA